jgi:hypothetical protein
LHVRVASAEDIDRAAGAAPKVQDAPRAFARAPGPALGIPVGKRLTRVIVRHDVTEQLLQVTAGQPEEPSPVAA